MGCQVGSVCSALALTDVSWALISGVGMWNVYGRQARQECFFFKVSDTHPVSSHFRSQLSTEYGAMQMCNPSGSMLYNMYAHHNMFNKAKTKTRCH